MPALRFQSPMARGGVEPPLPPYQSDMLPLQHRAGSRGGQNRTALSRAPATTALRGGARRVTITLHPESVRTAGFEPAISWPPTRRPIPLSRGQALPRSESNSSSGNRTPSSALKGQYPGPVDERAVCAHRMRKWVGWCSNPRLQVFNLALHRLSYRPQFNFTGKLHEKSPMSL